MKGSAMSKFYGPIGFVTFVEDPEGSGIWVEVAIEKSYRGEVNKNYKRWENSQHLNDDINISNTISIVADPYVSNNLNNIRYVKWSGNYWKITSVEVQYPRLVLTLGGVYNGPKDGTSSDFEEYPKIE